MFKDKIQDGRVAPPHRDWVYQLALCCALRPALASHSPWWVIPGALPPDPRRLPLHPDAWTLARKSARSMNMGRVSRGRLSWGAGPAGIGSVVMRPFRVPVPLDVYTGAGTGTTPDGADGLATATMSRAVPRPDGS